jgi:Ca-activated chloride channel family protein
MRKTISLAQDELRKTRKISDATRKTIKMGSRGKTILIDEQQDDSLSEETIRQISET